MNEVPWCQRCEDEPAFYNLKVGGLIIYHLCPACTFLTEVEIDKRKMRVGPAPVPSSRLILKEGLALRG